MEAMALAANEFARREGSAVEILPGAVRLSWQLPAMTTSDAHTLIGKFTCSARLADNPTDRKMFAEVLLGQSSVLRTNQLAEHFAPALRTASIEAAQKHRADAA